MAFRGTESRAGTAVKDETGESWSDDLHELPNVRPVSGEPTVGTPTGSWWSAESDELVAAAPEPEKDGPRALNLIGWIALILVAIPVIWVGGVPRLLVYLGIIGVTTALYSLLTRRSSWANFTSRSASVGALCVALVLTILGGVLVAQERPTQTRVDQAGTSEPISTKDPLATSEPTNTGDPLPTSQATAEPDDRASALEQLTTLEVKGRAPKTGYDRELQFGAGWQLGVSGCSLREEILSRDLTDRTMADRCKTRTGTLLDPFTGKSIPFTRGWDTSAAVQIDHVVALSNAWQTGAQQLTFDQRLAFANDPLNLIAVDGPSNQQKSDGDAATWLPPNKAYRCQYVARQISVKAKHALWVTPPERDAMERILSACPNQPAMDG